MQKKGKEKEKGKRRVSRDRNDGCGGPPTKKVGPRRIIW